MALDKASLGQRYICFDCETKFYDLNRPDPTCPSCGVDQRERPDDGAVAAAPKAPPAKEEVKEEVKEDSTEAALDAALATDVDIDDDDDDDDEEMGLSELGAPDGEAEEESDGEGY